MNESFWNFSQKVSLRLLLWALLSMVSGALLGRASEKGTHGRGLAAQFVGWGFIDALIALFGLVNTRRHRALPPEQQPLKQKTERRNLRRALWINTGLDVFYVLGGVLLIQRQGRENPEMRGHGLGIVIQGGFLFFFDLWHALKLSGNHA